MKIIFAWVENHQKRSEDEFLDTKSWTFENVSFAKQELLKNIFDIPLLS